MILVIATSLLYHGFDTFSPRCVESGLRLAGKMSMPGFALLPETQDFELREGKPSEPYYQFFDVMLQPLQVCGKGGSTRDTAGRTGVTTHRAGQQHRKRAPVNPTP